MHWRIMHPIDRCWPQRPPQREKGGLRGVHWFAWELGRQHSNDNADLSYRYPPDSTHTHPPLPAFPAKLMNDWMGRLLRWRNGLGCLIVRSQYSPLIATSSRASAAVEPVLCVRAAEGAFVRTRVEWTR
jgi:hypothetical protein